MTLLDSVSRGAPAGVVLRPEEDADLEFVERLYASVRARELAQVSWTVEAVADFLRSQCALQRAHYRQHYTDALFLIVERAGAAIGRLYLHETPGEVRLMDIGLLPDVQRQGIGTALITAVLDHGRSTGARVTLHVEPDNPAQRLYARSGFRLLERRGVYDFLEWTCPRPLHDLQAASFEAVRGEEFVLALPSGETLPLMLAAVNRRLAATPGGREGFSLVFDSASVTAHPQRIYRLEQRALGVMELFLVPIGLAGGPAGGPGGRPAPGGMRYEAVFG